MTKPPEFSPATDLYSVTAIFFELLSGNVIEISSMDSKKDLLELFCKYYSPSKIQAEKEAIIYDIINLVLGHTMTVMLIASAMRVHEITPEEMFKRLQHSLDPELMQKIPADKEEISSKLREQIMYQHLLNLFDMENFVQSEESNENLTHIMTNMSIVPYSGLESNIFNRWALDERQADKYNENIAWLINLRWVQFDEYTQFISLHPVISDVASRKLAPDSKKCDKLINRLLNFEEICSEKTYVAQMNYGLEALKLAYERISDATILSAILFGRYATLNYLLAHNDIALICQDKTVETFEELATYTHHEDNSFHIEFGLFEAYMNKSSILDNLRDRNTALEYSNKAIVLGERLKTEGTLYSMDSLALAYMNRGVIHEKLKQFEIAMSDKNKSVEIYERLFGEGRLDDENSLALAYMNRSVTYASLQMNNESIDDNEKCIDMWLKMKAAGKQVNENDLAKAYLNRSIDGTKRFLQKNEEQLDKEAKNNLLRNVMVYNKKNKK